MSTYRRLNTKRKRRHVDARSIDHDKDKREADARKGIFVVRPSEDARRNKPTWLSLGVKSSERIHRDGKVTECEGPEDFADYIDAEELTRNYAIVPRMKRGKLTTVRLTAGETPLEGVIVSFAPWVQSCIEDKATAGEDPNAVVLKIWALFVSYAKAMFVGDQERFFLGEAIHADTSSLHGDLVVSRFENGKRVGKHGLKTGGPGMVGCDRQLRAGAKISASKQVRYDRDVRGHFKRHGRDSRPFDVQLARLLDFASETILGPELVRYRAAYAASVPALEKQAIEMVLADMEAEKAAFLLEFGVQETSTPGLGPY